MCSTSCSSSLDSSRRGEGERRGGILFNAARPLMSSARRRAGPAPPPVCWTSAAPTRTSRATPPTSTCRRTQMSSSTSSAIGSRCPRQRTRLPSAAHAGPVRRHCWAARTAAHSRTCSWASWRTRQDAAARMAGRPGQARHSRRPPQMICKDCPHRSSRAEIFYALSLTVKNKKTILESLDEFVQGAHGLQAPLPSPALCLSPSWPGTGEMLQGDNAYKCSPCDKKVDTLKRQVIKRPPRVLVCHLKRFHFDFDIMENVCWERSRAAAQRPGSSRRVRAGQDQRCVPVPQHAKSLPLHNVRGCRWQQRRV
jgi:hypothetical protein